MYTEQQYIAEEQTSAKLKPWLERWGVVSPVTVKQRCKACGFEYEPIDTARICPMCGAENHSRPAPLVSQAEVRKMGRRIKAFRQRKNITSKQLGFFAGRSESQISKYEHGTVRPPVSVLKRLRILGMTVTAEEIERYEREDKKAEMERNNRIRNAAKGRRA